MTSCLQFGQSPPTPTVVFPIPVVEMRIVNSDPHRQQEKGLMSTPVPVGGIMCHPDLLEDVLQWTTVSHKKSGGKSRQANVIMASTLEPDSDVDSLTDSEKEEEVLATDIARPLAAATRSGQPYLRNMMALLSNSQCSPKNRLRSLPSSPKPRQRNRGRSGTIDPSIKEKRSRYLNPSALISSTNWPTSRPGSPFTSS